jgi:dTDP-4-amino-4,6-dideoxygalactose transaminase
MRSGWLTTGEECLALEHELSEYLGIPHVVAVSSCTAALEIALAYLDLPPGARVGVPTWTFASSALAAFRVGAVPVLLDVEPSTLNLSVDSLQAALEGGLDAVVGVHFGGVPMDGEIYKLCAADNVPVIEDSAHALGSSDHRGRIAGRGNLGACFSFYATKNLTSAEGGALSTESEDLASFARSYRLHGLSEDAWRRYRPGAQARYDLAIPGIKANLPDMLAAMARTQLARFADLQERRRQLVDRYRSRLQAVAGLEFVPQRQANDSADHLLVVALPEQVDRTRVVAGLSAEGIGTSVHFQPLHTLSWFRTHAEIGPSGTAVADAFAPRALSLPLHTNLSDADVDRVCDTLVGLLD